MTTHPRTLKMQMVLERDWEVWGVMVTVALEVWRRMCCYIKGECGVEELGLRGRRGGGINIFICMQIYICYI